MKLKHLFAAVAGAAAGVAAYASLVEPRWLQLRRRTIHIRSLPTRLEGLSVGLLTDVHVAAGGSTAVLDRAVRALAEAGPDLVAITGDLAEDATALESVLDALEPISAPLGVYVVPGNHDHRVGIDLWRAAVGSTSGLTDLTNRYRLLERDGSTICVAGVDDINEGDPAVWLPPPGARDLTVLLAHSPDQAEHCRRAYDAVDLILSGHTHGGQVRLPFLGAPVRNTRSKGLYDQGLRRRPWTQVYTSRGLGTTRLHVRFLARPEVSVLTLSARKRPAR